MHIFCCLRRATFDWPKVVKGQSGRGDGVAASCASLASPFGEFSSAPLRLLSHPHPLRWAADGSPASPFPTPIPLKRPNTGERGPKWSPAKRVHLGEEEQGSGPNFRRQAEIEGSGLCDDDVPPIGSTPRGSSTAASVSTGGLRCHAAGAGGAGAPPQRWRPWPNSKAFSPDKTVPLSIQGRHAPMPRLVHKPGGGKIGPKLFPVSPTDGRGREGCWA